MSAHEFKGIGRRGAGPAQVAIPSATTVQRQHIEKILMPPLEKSVLEPIVKSLDAERWTRRPRRVIFPDNISRSLPFASCPCKAVSPGHSGPQRCQRFVITGRPAKPADFHSRANGTWRRMPFLQFRIQPMQATACIAMRVRWPHSQ